MKTHTLIIAALLTAFAGTASAEMSLSGSARMGVKIVEGTAAVAATEGAYTAAQITALDTAVGTWAADLTAGAATDDTSAVTLLTELRADRAAAVTAFDLISGPTAAEVTSYNAAINAWDSAIDAADGTVGTAAVKDTITAVNRVRIAFTGSAETDAGLTFGASIRADNAVAGNAGTAGSSYISSEFGKVAMGDLDGADESAVGDLVGVGVAGAGDYNELAYQSAGHNLAYSFTANGLSLGASMDTSIQSGSNHALGASYSLTMADIEIDAGVGHSSIGNATQNSVGASVSMMGLSGTLAISQDDNGAGADTDVLGIGVGYNMGAISVNAFQKDVKTVGATDKTYQGAGIAYDLGNSLVAKVGIVRDDASRQTIDAGVSFSF